MVFSDPDRGEEYPGIGCVVGRGMYPDQVFTRKKVPDIEGGGLGGHATVCVQDRELHPGEAAVV